MDNEKAIESPRYQHDCDTCIFLGRKWHLELYFHPSSDAVLRTVIARFGSEGPDYESGVGMPTMGLYVATEAAVKGGLLPESAMDAYKRFEEVQ